MNTTVASGRHPAISIRHEPRTTLTDSERAGILVESDEDNDLLTEVRVHENSGPKLVRLFWRSKPSPDFHVLHAAESDVLFLGGGQVSAAVDLPASSVVSHEDHILFWRFERIGEFVVAFAETECLLFGLDGRVLQRAFVDPPYDVARTATGLEFRSIVAGTTFLSFPTSASP